MWQGLHPFSSYVAVERIWYKLLALAKQMFTVDKLLNMTYPKTSYKAFGSLSRTHLGSFSRTLEVKGGIMHKWKDYLLVTVPLFWHIIICMQYVHCVENRMVQWLCFLLTCLSLYTIAQWITALHVMNPAPQQEGKKHTCIIKQTKFSIICFATNLLDSAKTLRRNQNAAQMYSFQVTLYLLSLPSEVITFQLQFILIFF